MDKNDSGTLIRNKGKITLRAGTDCSGKSSLLKLIYGLGKNDSGTLIRNKGELVSQFCDTAARDKNDSGRSSATKVSLLVRL